MIQPLQHDGVVFFPHLLQSGVHFERGLDDRGVDVSCGNHVDLGAVRNDNGHGSRIDYCLLEERFQKIVNHFAEISVDVGILVIDHYIFAVIIG